MQERWPHAHGQATWTIITANCVMSLDNVLAIASIGQGRPGLIVVGLGVSTVLTLTGSVLIAEWMNRYPFLVTVRAGLLAWTDGRIIAADMVVSQTVALEFGVNLKDGPLWFVVSLMTTAFVLVASRQQNT